MEGLHKLSATKKEFVRWLNGLGEREVNSLFDLSEGRVVPRNVLPESLWPDAYAISCFDSETRWEFLDRFCERMAREGTHFFANPADPDAVEWGKRLKAIRRDVHKAHAFVRFKKTLVDGREVFIAWHRPQHHTLDLFVGLFCRRFPKMNWTVLTSEESAHFNDGELGFGAGFQGQSFEAVDDWEDYWRTYYSSIYNPARLMISAMKREMPMKHWQTMPETRLIPGLIRESRNLVGKMGSKAQSSASEYIPTDCDSLDLIRDHLPQCQGCRLFSHCRPTPGKGAPRADLMFVGEQPGDEEEKAGEPFIGPAGEVLRKAALEGEVPWNSIYVTNAVKHFKFTYEGGYRLHKRPDRDEVAACRPWLQKEIALVKPKTILCLGSTAALSVTGRLWPVERYRGTWLPTSGNYQVLLTYHPAAILRAGAEKSTEYYRDLVADLRLAKAS